MNNELVADHLARLDFESQVATRKPRAFNNRQKNEAEAAKRRAQYRQEQEAWKKR